MYVRPPGAIGGNAQSTHLLAGAIGSNSIKISFLLKILRPNHSIKILIKNNILRPKIVLNIKIIGLPEFSTPQSEFPPVADQDP